MQNSQTNRGRENCTTRAARMMGLTLGALTLSFASAIQAAEAPRITDAPILDAPHVAAPVMASEAPESANASALVEIATVLSGQFRVARGSDGLISAIAWASTHFKPRIIRASRFQAR